MHPAKAAALAYNRAHVHARTFMQQLDSGQAVLTSSPAPAMPFGLAVDGRKLMSRFFQLRDRWVREVALVLTAVITDAEPQTDIKVIGRAYALQAAQFDSFYPRFLEALDTASRGQSSAWDAAKFLADNNFKFFAAFTRGILGGAQSGPTMAVASIGATAPELVVPGPWAASQQPAAFAGAQIAGLSLPASVARGALTCSGATLPQPQPPAQKSQSGAALWGTVSTIESQIGGPSSAAAIPTPANGAQAALFVSQLAALQPSEHAAPPPPLTTPPPMHVAARAEGASSRQRRPAVHANSSNNRDDIWIPYSTAILGSYSPYSQLRPPELCYECNIRNSHAGKECPVRFFRTFRALLPAWTRDRRKDAAAWTGDGSAMLQPTREALARYLNDHGVPAHRSWSVSTAESGGAGPMSGPGRTTVTGASTDRLCSESRVVMITFGRWSARATRGWNWQLKSRTRMRRFARWWWCASGRCWLTASGAISNGARASFRLCGRWNA